MFFVVRIFFTMIFWVVIARWTYAELSQVSPIMKDSVDGLMEIATIPTHDQWDIEAMKNMATNFMDNLKSKEAFARE